MSLVKADLKRLHSPDIHRLEDFKPIGSFGILIQAMIGPLGRPGEESFDIVVCTPQWFASRMKEEDIISGRHYVFMHRFELRALEKYITSFCRTCSGESWKIVAEKVGRLGKWEFEDYESSSSMHSPGGAKA